MMDVLHKVLKFVDHNRWLVVCLVIAAVAVGGLIGCQSMTASLVEPGRKVTRAELAQEVATIRSTVEQKRIAAVAAVEVVNAEVAGVNEQITNAAADLDLQDAMKCEVLDVIADVATTVTAGLVPGAAQYIPTAVGIIGLLLGFGAMADNRRKDKIIAASSGGPDTG